MSDDVEDLAKRLRVLAGNTTEDKAIELELAVLKLKGSSLYFLLNQL